MGEDSFNALVAESVDSISLLLNDPRLNISLLFFLASKFPAAAAAEQQLLYF